ncbi:Chromosome partition protein Smc [Nocardioides dokdonensis FR1436]|uniref:Chromosome partition protein Smc n=1 Tax=Nocardioides dokdonensis FR1436 TaxID=1300347 RepID=A0A1A9GP30_9ACTN|nr:SbcC/MukB-like Walker B domain-containing protein [Nocardioides dokdonensis]ANH39231.1 Chromosome partition protein Smc [Nocardioides dokdonensis FR1436]
MTIDESEQVGARTDGLFEHQLVAAPTDDTMQWRAGLLQMVNWGGFSGLTEVPLGSDSTMISGASGVGKSTILDAYTALMMPSDTKFNGASNDAVAGRARGIGQRNLLSYLRGAVDVIDDPRTGRPVEKLLRGQGADTWGAVAVTFVNDRGGSFTALRTYYVPRRAIRSSEVQMQLVTHDGPLGLETLEVAVPERFHANTLKKLYPGVRVHRTYAELAEVLHARLGIGAGGDGSKALRLLSRIQAGNQVRSVDELYKDMVLERPATYAAADRAIEHFDDLDAAHAAMRTEEQKLDLLEPITALHERRGAAAQRLAELDSFGVTVPGDTPLRRWLLRTHRRLIETAVTTNRADRAATSEALALTRSAETALAGDLEAAKDAHRDAGGGDLQALAAQVEHERAIRAERGTRLAELEERVYPLVGLTDVEAPDLDSALDSVTAFAALQLHARKALAASDEAQARLRTERDEVRDGLLPLKNEQTALRRERASLESRAGRVPAHLHELRAEVARATGLDVDDLPFVAELLDVAPEESRWRTAVETVLGGTARTMLVPLERLADFSSAIDQLRLRTRFTFQGVELDLPSTGPSDPERIAGKLLFKDSPFSGWVQQHVADPARNAYCVETAAGLDGPGFRVTEAGQTRNGRRGAHGRGDQRSIIGFSNEEAVAEVDAQLRELEQRMLDHDARISGLDQRAARLAQQRQAYDAIAMVRYDDVDVAGCDRRIAELEQRRDDILAADDQLQVLQDQIEDLGRRLDETRQRRYALEQQQQALGSRHGELVEAEDHVNDRLEASEGDEGAGFTAEQDAALTAELAAAAAPADPDDLDRFAENAKRLEARLHEAVAEATTEVERVEADLTSVFRQYKTRWDSPNLGATADSYPDYARILEEIRGKGLADRRSEWRRRLTEWSGQDLVPLVGAMAASVEEIEDRLVPINTILKRLEFGGAGDRLRIRLRRLSPVHVQAFMKDLRGLSSGVSAAGAAPGEDDLERRFVELSSFMEQLRPQAPGGAPTDRDRLLDVRRHVEVSAERYDHLTGELRATYRTLGEKSGGESQELVAFIVGSALRFRLGDEMRSRPRFAPVFLDEGFVKADSEFAGRAVRAWKGLGFQLIIGVPLDKVTGLEPHMDALLAITKNTATHQAWITPITDASSAAG